MPKDITESDPFLSLFLPTKQTACSVFAGMSFEGVILEIEILNRTFKH